MPWRKPRKKQWWVYWRRSLIREEERGGREGKERERREGRERGGKREGEGGSLAKINAFYDDVSICTQSINNEEELLEWELTPFPQIQSATQLKEPFDKLWNTAEEFHEKHEMWMNGPFLNLNAEQVQEDVGNMWRMMHKLSKTFGEMPSPKRSTELFKMKLEKFKENLPLLSTFCNPGIRDRHWSKMSDIVGFELKPSPDTPLSVMLEYGLQQYLTQ